MNRYGSLCLATVLAHRVLLAVCLAVTAGLWPSSLLAGSTATSPPHSEAANIPDPALRRALEDALGLEPGATITEGDIAAMQGTFAAMGGVVSLTGLEHATGLDALLLPYNEISDLSPLSNLTNLSVLAAWSNSISDLTPLAGLTNLTTLSLSYNLISDLSPLTRLTGLEQLYLEHNAIAEASVLGELENLAYLNLGDNPIIDFSPLSGLGNLVRLGLHGTAISDLSPLSELSGLTVLDLSSNAISDLRPLANLTRLERLNLDSNLISDLRPLAMFEMPELREVDLGANRISDLSPLSGATLRLQVLHLPDNAIADISPLLDNIAITSEVDLRHNPLNRASVNEHIPALRDSDRGMRVEFRDDDHSDYAKTASPIALGGFARGSIEPYHDRDFFRLEVASPVEAVIFASDYSDVAFRLFDAAGKLLAAPGSNSSRTSQDIRRHLDRGTYFIRVNGRSSGYVLNVQDAQGEAVAIADANLRAAVEAALDKAPGEPITAIEMARLAILRANDRGIASLAGLERATGLRRLELARNQITNISPLAGLTNLSWALHLDDNAISDISPLAALVHLSELDLASNAIADLSPLAGLTEYLEVLRLDDNVISDLSPLAGFVALDHLGLDNNLISDVSPLAGLIGTEGLGLNGNQIADISPLAGLADLEYLGLNNNKVTDISALPKARLLFLDLNGNLISDLSPLAGFTELRRLNLRANAIVDISTLAGLSDLRVLDLGDNEVSDVSALAGLASLEELRLDGNQIEDIAPLKDLVGLCQLHLDDNRIMDVSPLAALSRGGCLWLVSLHRNPLDHRSLADTLPLLKARGAAVALEDDHGSTLEAAPALPVGGSRKGVISHRNDVDAFRLDIAEAVDLRLFTSGSLDTSGRLLDEGGNPIEGGYSPDGSHRYNFLFDTRLEPGTYYVEVASDDIGGYILHAPDAKANAALVPLLLSAANTGAQGFVRIINHSAEAGTVRLHAREDGGWLHEPITLNIGARQTRHFNSQDLESGNLAKGLDGGTGPGRGDWLLQFESDLDIEALAYARTKDGFLTAMHDVAPVIEVAGQPKHRVVTFNPASNWRQVSSLRLINSARESSSTEIDGRDDLGASRSVGLTLASGAAHQITAQQLEAGHDLFWQHRQPSFGDGTGKWRLDVSGLQGLRVMSLMSSPTGHLTNLSTAPPHPADGVHRVPLFPSASDPSGRQGFLRIVNRSYNSGTVTLRAKDDSLGDYPPITLSLMGNAAKHINSQDLEHGNSSKGLSGGIGAGVGHWRLEVSSEDRDIQVLTYIRTPDGFLTSIHDLAPSIESLHRVAIFNPASNRRQVSLLRIINDGLDDALVTIGARDDAGVEPATPVRLTVPARSTRTLTAEQLESGDRDIEGALGDGTGKWQFNVTSTQPISVMSLMQSPTGHLTNLSTAPRLKPPD